MPNTTELFRGTFRAFKEPPYIAAATLATLLSLASIIWERHFRVTFAVFLYAIVGLLWHHFIADIRRVFNIQPMSAGNQVLTVIYHIGNVALVIVLARILIDLSAGIVEVTI